MTPDQIPGGFYWRPVANDIFVPVNANGEVIGTNCRGKERDKYVAAHIKKLTGEQDDAPAAPEEKPKRGGRRKKPIPPEIQPNDADNAGDGEDEGGDTETVDTGL